MDRDYVRYWGLLYAPRCWEGISPRCPTGAEQQQRPKHVGGLEITRARNPEWTDEEKEKLMREQMQGELFDAAQAREQIRTLRKVPFDFHYRCVFETPDGETE